MAYETKNGLFAFFDVLGYQNIILNNRIQDVAEIIDGILLKVPITTRQAISNRVHDVDATQSEAIMECMGKPIVFSDSIVCDLSFNESLLGGRETQWHLFIIWCCCLQRFMFEGGLPLRGAISMGEYYIKDNCFAGKPAVEAYDLCHRLELSGCGLTVQAERKLPTMPVGDGIDAFSPVLTTYPTPLKGIKKPQDLKMLNWAFPGGTLLEPFGNEIRQRLTDSFGAHGKEIPVEVYEKLSNTEAFLKHCKKDQEAFNKKCPGPV